MPSFSNLFSKTGKYKDLIKSLKLYLNVANIMRNLRQSQMRVGGICNLCLVNRYRKATYIVDFDGSLFRGIECDWLSIKSTFDSLS